ncbi:MAG: DoxX protein [Cyanophyceae cyanobacterium]
MTLERKLELGLATIRLTTAAFFLVWSIEKIVAPELTQRVFEGFYFSQISNTVSYLLGSIQTAIILVFLAGIWKTLSYGAILGMHTVSVVSTYERLLNPYELPNHLFWAGIPTLGAVIALFLLRDSDTFLTLSTNNRPRRP